MPLWLGVALGFGAGLLILFKFPWPIAIVLFVAWMANCLGWLGYAFAYDASLLTNGETHFRSLFRRRIVRASEVTRIRIKRGEGGRSIVVQSRGSVWLRYSNENEELGRRIKAHNPAIELEV